MRYAKIRNSYYGKDRMGMDYPVRYIKQWAYVGILMDGHVVKLNWKDFTERFTLI